MDSSLSPNASKLEFDVTVFALVGPRSQAEAELIAFERQALAREAYTISGGADFLLKCVASDLTGPQNFIIQDLTAAANVESVETSLILRVSKYAPGVPIP